MDTRRVGIKKARRGHLCALGLLLLSTSLFAQQNAGPLTPRAPSPGDHAGAPATSTASAAPAAPAVAAETTSENREGQTAQYVVPSGTRLPLVLHNSLTTRNAQPGDPLYFETVFPVVLNDRILVPAGSYVQGEVLEAQRPGRVKGRGEVRIRLTTMILPTAIP